MNCCPITGKFASLGMVLPVVLVSLDYVVYGVDRSSQTTGYGVFILTTLTVHQHHQIQIK